MPAVQYSSVVDGSKPVLASYVVIGDLCAFNMVEDQLIMIGKVLQFTKFCTTRKNLPYRGNYAEIDDSTGVLCIWYVEESQGQYKMSSANSAYYPINTYLCTLTQGCISNYSIEARENALPFEPVMLHIGESFTISQECIEFISSLMPKQMSCKPIDLSQQQACADLQNYTAADQAPSVKQWIKCGSIILSNNERLALYGGKALSDLHIDAAQHLLKTQFKGLNGLQSTLYQLIKKAP